VSLYQSWASLEIRQHNVDAAKRLIAKALTLDKRNGSGWLIAANIEERLGNDGLVGLILRRGIECAPTSAELYRALGDLLLQKGDINNVSSEYSGIFIFCLCLSHAVCLSCGLQAREILEKGIEVNPLHAPTYHSLAELEARVFNVEGLAKLNRKAAAIFSHNVMQPNPSSTQALGANLLKFRHSNEIPRGIKALAEKIVEDEVASELEELSMMDKEDMDPFATFEQMMNANLIEDELVGDMLLNKNQTSSSL